MDMTIFDKSLFCMKRMVDDIDKTLQDIPENTGVSNRLLTLREIICQQAVVEDMNKNEVIQAYCRTDTKY